MDEDDFNLDAALDNYYSTDDDGYDDDGYDDQASYDEDYPE